MQANRILAGFITAMLMLANGQWSQAGTDPHQSYVDGELLVSAAADRQGGLFDRE